MSVSNNLKDLVRTALYRSGLLGAWHRRRNKRALTVLMFHRVLPAGSDALSKSEREFAFSLPGFQKTLDFVERHYNVVDLPQVKAAADGLSALPTCPLLITFDDGWRDTVVHAMPELKRRGLPALLFLATEVIDLEEKRWWQDAAVAVLADPNAASKLTAALGMSAQEVGQPSFSQKIAASLAGLPESDRRRLLKQVVPTVLDQIADRQMMNADDLNRWIENGYQIGGHGHTHSPIAYANNPNAEVKSCLSRLQSMNLQILSLSYPHGVKSDQSRSLLEEAGFDLVFDSSPNLVNTSHLHRLRFDLPRIHLPENAWTTTNGHVDSARLATYLFPRSVI